MNYSTIQQFINCFKKLQINRNNFFFLRKNYLKNVYKYNEKKQSQVSSNKI